MSHDKGVIQSICDRAILLSEGRIAMQGAPDLAQALNPQLIASQTLGGVLGGVYEWVDETAELDETYVYFLAVRNLDGSVELHASNVIKPGKVVKFWMPMMWGGGKN